ncbi:hypothetical protein MishRS11D_25290 [Methylomagnum ishizawai]|nr:hypothetical protein MishRS11D_25290 [Methylomagnum ishizawai]
MALTAQTDHQMRIRLPADVKEWIAMEAERNERSQNAEIVFRLKQSREAQSEKAPSAENT